MKMGTVWDRTAEFLGDNAGLLLPVALLAFFAPASIGTNLETVMAGASGGVRLALGIAQILLALVTLWGSLAVIALSTGASRAETAGHLARLRLLPATLVTLVLGVAMAVLAIPVPIFLAYSGVDLAQMSNGMPVSLDRSVGITVAIYSLGVLAVLLWAAARLAVVNAVVLREGAMLGAIPRAWRLTRGYALRILGVLILFVVVAAVSRLAASTVFGSVFALVVGNDGDGLSLAGVLTSIVTAAVQAAFMVLMAAFQGKLYLALAAKVPPPDAVLAA
ncbi:hypothetical protein ACX40Y_10785 [Sphingomonas sp. RS6]